MFSKWDSQDLKPGSFPEAHTLKPKPSCNAASLKINQVSSGVTLSSGIFPNLSELKKYSSSSILKNNNNKNLVINEEKYHKITVLY